MADLNTEDWEELESIVHQLRSFARETKAWELMFFEHGAGSNIDTSGACVDHAHLHAVRFHPEFLGELRKSVPLVHLPSLKSARLVANKAEGYALYLDDRDNCWLANDPKLPSQYFRMLYSRLQEGPQVWNWRSDPRVSEVSRVIRAYSALHLTPHVAA